MEIRSEDWRRRWKEYLKDCVKNDKKFALSVNAETGAMNGILKRGEEIIEVVWSRRESENEVELTVMNIVDHTARVLKGLVNNVLNEVNTNGFNKNEIVDLNADGRRWEGGVLKGEVFGYGCLYDEENELEYEGWMIGGKKKFYGVEYWSDVRKRKYSGYYYNGLKNGYGVLYDRNGMIEYEGLFKDDNPSYKAIYDERGIVWDEDCELNIDICALSLSIDHGFSPNISSILLNCQLISLKRIDFGNKCLNSVSRFVIDGLNELETVVIGENSFNLDSCTKGSEFVIMNCDQLREIHIGYQSFYWWYETFELKNLPSLISVQLDKYAFYYCSKIVFESMIRE